MSECIIFDKAPSMSLLKRESDSGIFLLILQKFYEHLWATAAVYERNYKLLGESCKCDSAVKRKNFAVYI